MAKLCKSEDINIIVYILVILFGTGSWVAVNGLWVELPLLVQDLPEAWNLPSFLVIIIQIANIGPLSYSLARKFCGQYLSDKIVVYVLVLIGAVSCLLLAFVWGKTVIVAGKPHSVALFALAFFLATVDCTSSVVFLPFMSLLKPQYVTAYFIGEGLSGLIPSLAALAQGASGPQKCVNITVNTTTGEHTKLVPVPVPPNFGVDVFFGFLFAMMVLCGVAFFLINHLPACKKEHAETKSQTNTSSASTSSEDVSSHQVGEAVLYRAVRHEDKGNRSERYGSGNIKVDTFPVDESRSQEPILQPASEANIPTSVYVYLLILTGLVNAISNGILPSIQSYSAIPYGYTSYHLAVTLSSITNPLVCFALFIVPTRSKKLVTFLTLVAVGFMGYITFLAASSPDPPLVDHVLGQIIMVSLWILTVAVISCVKVTLATILRDRGKSALFWYGAVTQVGSAIGAMIAFVIVNELRLFKSKPPCT